MRQQINLYHPMFRSQRQLLGAVAIVQGLVSLLVGLAAVTGYAIWQLDRLGAEHETVKVQRAAAERRLVQFEQMVPKRIKSRILTEERERLERRLDSGRELLETVSRRTLDRSEGFAAFFEGLARQRVEGLWLTGFDISHAGQQLQIAGSAVRPELVPMLVQRLAAEATFRGASFRSLTIDRPDETPQQVDFVLQTVPEDEN